MMPDNSHPNCSVITHMLRRVYQIATAKSIFTPNAKSLFNISDENMVRHNLGIVGAMYVHVSKINLGAMYAKQSKDRKQLAID
jgi:hypothetical protein